VEHNEEVSELYKKLYDTIRYSDKTDEEVLVCLAELILAICKQVGAGADITLTMADEDDEGITCH
jgi:hypothetical protein